MTLPRRLRWLWLTIAVVLLDRGTKAWFETQTPGGWRHQIVRHLIYLVHNSNPGIAFSLFSDFSASWMRFLLISGSLVVIAGLAWLFVAGKNISTMSAVGLALLLGGATGNVTDRIIYGAVTDFFEVWLGSYRWPAFNVADSAITIGAILIILDALLGPRSHESAGRGGNSVDTNP